MQIKLQAIECGRTRLVQTLTFLNSFPPRIATLMVAVLLVGPAAFAEGITQTSSGTSAAQQKPVPSVSPTQQRPGQQPAPTPEAQTPSSATQPGANQQGQSTTPAAQEPRSVVLTVQQPAAQQPAPGQSLQTISPTTAAPGTPQPGNPAGTQLTTGGQRATGQNVGIAAGIAPAELPTEPPPVAPNFEAPARLLPSAERVGVDIVNQTPITLIEAISLALQNNNDIDSSRIDVKIAEFNLTGSRGVYDPVLSSESFYESRTTRLLFGMDRLYGCLPVRPRSYSRRLL